MITAALSREGADERAGGVWEYVSASRLNLWLKCPLAFKLKYIDGVRMPATPNMFVGKQTHQALETWYRHRQIGMPITVADVEACMEASWGEQVAAEGVTFADASEERKCRQSTAALVSTYLAQVAPDEPRPLAVETSLTAPLVDPRTGEDLGIPLLGVLDPCCCPNKPDPGSSTSRRPLVAVSPMN